MEIKINIGVSNRHVHLTKETYDFLFDEDITSIKDLHQGGEYISNAILTLKTDKFQIDNVKVLGPLRKYNQVEISNNDARKFGINPPVRRSSDVENGAKITLVTPKNELTINNCIIAQRHIHMTMPEAEKYGVVDKQIVKLKLGNIKSGVIDAHVKISDNAFFEAHIDTDDANAFLINNDDEGTLII